MKEWFKNHWYILALLLALWLVIRFLTGTVQKTLVTGIVVAAVVLAVLTLDWVSIGVAIYMALGLANIIPHKWYWPFGTPASNNPGVTVDNSGGTQ